MVIFGLTELELELVQKFDPNSRWAKTALDTFRTLGVAMWFWSGLLVGAASERPRAFCRRCHCVPLHVAGLMANVGKAAPAASALLAGS